MSDNYFFQIVVILFLGNIAIKSGVDVSFCNYLMVLSTVILFTLQILEFIRVLVKK